MTLALGLEAAVLMAGDIETVEIPPDPVVKVAPVAKLIAVSDVPTELPACSNSIPETTPVKALPSPRYEVAVQIPVTLIPPAEMSIPPAVTLTPPSVTLIPLLAVIRPTESILVTSSYVNVPPMVTLPL